MEQKWMWTRLCFYVFVILIIFKTATSTPSKTEDNFYSIKNLYSINFFYDDVLCLCSMLITFILNVIFVRVVSGVSPKCFITWAIIFGSGLIFFGFPWKLAQFSFLIVGIFGIIFWITAFLKFINLGIWIYALKFFVAFIACFCFKDYSEEKNLPDYVITYIALALKFLCAVEYLLKNEEVEFRDDEIDKKDEEEKKKEQEKKDEEKKKQIEIQKRNQKQNKKGKRKNKSKAKRKDNDEDEDDEDKDDENDQHENDKKTCYPIKFFFLLAYLLCPSWISFRQFLYTNQNYKQYRVRNSDWLIRVLFTFPQALIFKWIGNWNLNSIFIYGSIKHLNIPPDVNLHMALGMDFFMPYLVRAFHYRCKYYFYAQMIELQVLAARYRDNSWEETYIFRLKEAESPLSLRELYIGHNKPLALFISERLRAKQRTEAYFDAFLTIFVFCYYEYYTAFICLIFMCASFSRDYISGFQKLFEKIDFWTQDSPVMKNSIYFIIRSLICGFHQMYSVALFMYPDILFWDIFLLELVMSSFVDCGLFIGCKMIENARTFWGYAVNY